MERLEPKRFMPYVDNALPNRAQLRRDNEEPRVTKSKIDMLDANLHRPYTESELPTRAKLRKLQAEPTFT
jgi:hypothetical protein